MVLAALVAMAVAMFCSRERKAFFSPYGDSWITESGVVWTTEYHITYHSHDNNLGDSIQLILSNLDKSVSPYNKASLISALNNNTSTRVDAYLKRLFAASAIINRESGGAFDPTVMPLVNAWGFGYKDGALPSRTQIDSILQFVGMGKVSIHGDSLMKKDPRVMLDFSSIAKGLACDEIGHMFTRNGISDWLVEIGGEVAASGVNKNGTPWQVSVDMPNEEQDGKVSHESALTLSLNNATVATSGNYRKWRAEEGNKLSHIIDPHTGESAIGTLLSVTVIADECMHADAWATACMVLGDSATRAMMQHRDDLGVMTITADTISGSLIVWSNRTFANQITTSR